MLLAKLARDGGLYSLPAHGSHSAYEWAECHGFNSTREWLLFVVNDQWGRKKMLMVGPDELIKEIH